MIQDIKRIAIGKTIAGHYLVKSLVKSADMCCSTSGTMVAKATRIVCFHKEALHLIVLN